MTEKRLIEKRYEYILEIVEHSFSDHKLLGRVSVVKVSAFDFDSLVDMVKGKYKE